MDRLLDEIVLSCKHSSLLVKKEWSVILGAAELMKNEVNRKADFNLFGDNDAESLKIMVPRLQNI